MRYLKINLDPVKLKADPNDLETLQTDLYEHVQALLDTESLGWTIDEESEEDAED